MVCYFFFNSNKNPANRSLEYIPIYKYVHTHSKYIIIRHLCCWQTSGPRALTYIKVFVRDVDDDNNNNNNAYKHICGSCVRATAIISYNILYRNNEPYIPEAHKKDVSILKYSLRTVNMICYRITFLITELKIIY